MPSCIYIVDDDADILASVESLLSAEGEVVTQGFTSGVHFLSGRSVLEPGVLLLDFEMPGRSGLDVLMALRQEADARFAPIMLTGHADISLVVEAMRAGAIDFLEKPFAAEDLIQAVRSAFKWQDDGLISSGGSVSAMTRINGLSPREKDVLRGLLNGSTNNRIGANLAISPRTVEIYRGNLMKKLGADTLCAALKVAFSAGFIPAPQDT
jgi:two-component system response regulator FixJ